jgi:endogenous inhibitor of DNA gyrase (YacG/DUF329 family)
MRPDALCGANSTATGPSTSCPICGAVRSKSRKWTTYCSDRCRKAAWLIRKQSETPADIRATLSRIESKLDALLGAK